MLYLENFRSSITYPMLHNLCSKRISISTANFDIERENRTILRANFKSKDVPNVLKLIFLSKDAFFASKLICFSLKTVYKTRNVSENSMSSAL